MRVRLSFIRERLAMDVIDQLLADLQKESCVFCRLDATEHCHWARASRCGVKASAVTGNPQAATSGGGTSCPHTQPLQPHVSSPCLKG
jgi:hypothetical protein